MKRIKELRYEVLSLIRTLYKTLGELTTELETPEPAPEPVDRNEKLSKMLEVPLGGVVHIETNKIPYYFQSNAINGYNFTHPAFISWLLDRLAATGHDYRGIYRPDNQQHYFEVWGPDWEYSGEALNPDRHAAVLEAAYAAAEDYWEKVGK